MFDDFFVPNDYLDCDLTSCLIEINYVKTILFDLETAHNTLKKNDVMFFRNEFIKQINSIISSYMLYEEKDLMNKFRKYVRQPTLLDAEEVVNEVNKIMIDYIDRTAINYNDLLKDIRSTRSNSFKLNVL